MRLYLTSYEPWNSSYCTSDGHILFKVQLNGRIASVRRALPNLKPTSEGVLWQERHFQGIGEHHTEPDHDHSSEDDSEITEERRRKSFESLDHPFDIESPVPSREELDQLASIEERDTEFSKLAEIEFHNISSTRIRYMENDWQASQLFTKGALGQYGSDRIFHGTDGKEYKWRMRSRVSELFLMEATNVPFLVARLYNPHLGSPHKKSPASLEIFPVGEHLTDLILTTAIYIERMRKERENSTNDSLRSPAKAQIHA